MQRAIGKIDRAIGWLTDQISGLLLLTIAVVVLYNVLMRYVFDAPPFWSDRISVFANMGMILFGFSLTVRGRDLIAMQALYEKISPTLALVLDSLWNAIILIFSLVFAWYGVEAAVNMPGQYWDFQDFCIDLGLGDAETKGVLLTFFKSFEELIALIVRPFCVDGAVPQKYLAILMPVSGVLLVIASLGVLIEDAKRFVALRRGEADPSASVTQDFGE
jgi:TRAP-type C4-dicarboxylate transport system permease small subunit